MDESSYPRRIAGHDSASRIFCTRRLSVVAADQLGRLRHPTRRIQQGLGRDMGTFLVALSPEQQPRRGGSESSKRTGDQGGGKPRPVDGPFPSSVAGILQHVPAAGRQPRCYSTLLSFLSPPTTACYLRPTGETSRRPTTYRDQRPDQNMLQQGRPPATGVTPRHGGPNPSTKRLSTKRWPHVGIIVEVGRNSVRPRSYPVLLASSSLLWRNRRHLRPKRIASLGEEEKRNERTSARPRWTTCARNSPMQPTGANERPRRSETSKRILKRYVDFEMSSNSTFVPQYDTRAVTRG